MEMQLCWEPWGGKVGGEQETEDSQPAPCPDPGARARKEERDASECGLVSPSQLASTLHFHGNRQPDS